MPATILHPGFKPHSLRSSPRRRQRGFDLVQIAIVIGVIGILMAAAFIGVPAVMASVRATGEASDLQSYVLHQQHDMHAGAITNDTVISARYYNAAGVTAPNIIRNRFGGTVTITADANSPDFQVTTESVPARACEKLIPIIAPSFQAITIGAVDVKTVTEPLSAQGAIADACATGTGGRVTITLTALR